ncbi:hypothetical protein BaRGS_00015961 [Batillaria attramentaria]|uniref:Uncharacterized protein n=1 Tax=Batillaria attramentaria TaxID=370345 RepID=A0ABD0L0L6_9CAEN
MKGENSLSTVRWVITVSVAAAVDADTDTHRFYTVHPGAAISFMRAAPGNAGGGSLLAFLATNALCLGTVTPSAKTFSALSVFSQFGRSQELVTAKSACSAVYFHFVFRISLFKERGKTVKVVEVIFKKRC